MSITYTSGIPHTSGAPTHTPTAQGGKLAYDSQNGIIYKHVTGSTWEQLAIGSSAFDGERSVTAGENINAGRVVVVVSGQAFYFQPSDPTHAGRTLGVSKNAATNGNAVIVAFVGEVTDAGFSGLSDAVLWAGNNGVIQTNIPSSGTIQKVGVGLGSNTILIDFSTQITR